MDHSVRSASVMSFRRERAKSLRFLLYGRSNEKPPYPPFSKGGDFFYLVGNGNPLLPRWQGVKPPYPPFSKGGDFFSPVGNGSPVSLPTGGDHIPPFVPSFILPLSYPLLVSPFRKGGLRGFYSPPRVQQKRCGTWSTLDGGGGTF